MGNQEDYEKIIGVIRAIDNSQIISPHNTPVATCIQEAGDIYKWALEDREALIAVGLSWEQVEDLPVRCGALSEAEARWQEQWNSRKESSQELNKRSPLAYKLRNKLLTDFRFAFRKHPHLLTKVTGRSKEKNQTKLIQALNDLSILGKENSQLLEAIGFDISLLDKASQTADEMSGLLARVNREKGERGKAKKIRDQAYTHLKGALDDIRNAGQYAFRQDKVRFKMYRSKHIRKLTIKKREKAKKKGAEKT